MAHPPPALQAVAVPEGPGSSELELCRIGPESRWSVFDIAELWRYRELLYFLVWRDVKVRYKQTVLGIAWAVIQPVFAMGVFSLFFGALAKIGSEGFPYPVFNFAALLPWTFFSNSVANAGNSLLGNSALLTKVYFPRIIIPGAGVLAGVIDFAIGTVVMFALLAWYGIRPPATLLFTLPLLTLLVLLLAFSLSLWLSALNVKYRDVRYVIPFLLQSWMFATPIVYPSSVIPEKYRWLAALNPAVGLVEGFRSAFLGRPWPTQSLAICIGFTLVATLGGLHYFRYMEGEFADVI